ncbi:M3 family oligoendopeptidase [Carnobacterium gallinarum]|uniref:M3 family oligoendopeptidase n=1 Tax=Carnobacterium gallinarum TaxID=2749 RepID=UPI000552C0E1|nr:M3 family oligoendopeptidase [Carnobacterium gallinarum]
MTIDYDWNLNDIFNSTDSFYHAINECNESFEYWEHKSNYLEVDLLDNFKNIEKTYSKLNKIYCFAFLQFSISNNENSVKRKFDLATKSYDIFDQLVVDFKKNILTKYSYDYITELKKVEYFKYYKKFLTGLLTESKDGNTLFQQISPYTEYQKIMYTKNSIGSIQSNESTIELYHTNQLFFLMHDNQEIRKKTYNQFLDFYLDIKDQVAYLYKIVVIKFNLDSQNEGFSNYYEKFLSSSLGIFYKEISSFILYETAISQEIVNYQKKMTGLKKISYSDLYYEKKYSDYIISKEKAIEILEKIYRKISNDWALIFRKMINERWIDWHSKKEKRTGGFSINVYEVHPYILLNWTNDLNGLYTLAHESIGAIINYQSRNVNFLNTQHSVLITELYSQIMENEVNEYLINTYSDEPNMNSFIKERELVRFKDNIIKPIMNTEFEIKNFRDLSPGLLNSKKFSNNYEKISKLVYGKCEDFDSNNKNSVNWVKQAHIFKPFYDSSYVVTFLLAKYIKTKKTGYQDLLKVAKIGAQYSDEEILTIFLNIDLTDFIKSTKENLRSFST